MSGYGASRPLAGALSKVGYLNGYRPFSLGGGNGSKCPEAATHPGESVVTIATG